MLNLQYFLYDNSFLYIIRYDKFLLNLTIDLDSFSQKKKFFTGKTIAKIGLLTLPTQLQMNL